jgi:DNA-binding GntR family transcriptional regulator
MRDGRSRGPSGQREAVRGARAAPPDGNGGPAARKGWTQQVSELVERIEIAVLFGEYRPRERLIQDELSEKYGVERNVVRTALNRLAEKGVVQHFPNRGSQVREVDAADAKHLYRARMLLEAAAAEAATEHVTAAILARLTRLSESMERHLRRGDLRRFMLDHERFHEVIFEAARNPYLLRMIKALRSASTSIRNLSYSRYVLREATTQLFAEHKEMVAALHRRDPQRMRELARTHILAGINHYLRTFFPREPALN